MYPRSPPTAGKNLEFCQPGEDLPTDLNQLVQPMPQIFNVCSIKLIAFIHTFCHLIQIVAAILKQVRHPAQLRQVKVQTITIQCHFADIRTQTADAHAIHLFVNPILFGFCDAQDQNLVPLFSHRASPSRSE